MPRVRQVPDLGERKPERGSVRVQLVQEADVGGARQVYPPVADPGQEPKGVGAVGLPVALLGGEVGGLVGAELGDEGIDSRRRR